MGGSSDPYGQAADVDKRMKATKKRFTVEEEYYLATQWQLMWRKLKKHRVAIVGICILLLFATGAIFCEFLSPYGPLSRNTQRIYCPPQRLHFRDQKDNFTIRPHIYGLVKSTDTKTMKRVYTEDPTQKFPVKLFVHGTPYKFWGVLETDIHLFGVEGEDATIFLFGTDKLGRDLLTRNLYASRISLSIGLFGVSLAFILGSFLGGVSGFFGGPVDMLIQRIVEFLVSIPHIPLWMGLSAALPREWSSIQIYLGISIILSLIGWCPLARVVRGRILELRQEDFAMAAKVSGLNGGQIIAKHMLPSLLSYLVVSLTLAIPHMILGETALSFIGLGIQTPSVSWGTLLREAQSLQVIVLYPWLLIPGIFVIIAVLAFNFMGDGLRDAADPYK